MRNKDTPIKTYSIDQIGPNAQFGGVQLGFGMLTYQVVISFSVYTVPTAPAKKTINMDTTNLGISFQRKSILCYPQIFKQKLIIRYVPN